MREPFGQQRDDVASVIDIAEHRELGCLSRGRSATRIQVGKARYRASCNWLLGHLGVRWCRHRLSSFVRVPAPR